MSNANIIRVTVERTVLDDPADTAAALKALGGVMHGEVPAALFGDEEAEGTYGAQVWLFDGLDYIKATGDDTEAVAVAHAVAMLTASGDLTASADDLTDGKALWQWAEANGLDPEDVGTDLAERGLTDTEVASVLAVLTREWSK